MESGLIGIVLGSVLLIGFGMIPGLALIRILDPGADRLRQMMLLPAASLLILYGLAGWLVVILGEHSLGALILSISIINILSATLGWQRESVRVRRLSAWERLEEIEAAAEAEAGTIELEVDVIAERKHAALIETGRPDWLPWALGISALICLTPLLILERPMGVDWLGFATLSHRLAETGSLLLPDPNVGRWTYPPAFPALAAFLEQVTGMSPSDSVHLLGQLSLLAILWGVAGAADRWGASATTLLALCLAPALFAKAFDSGYPTVASQLGLVLGLLVLVKPPRERSKRMDFLFAFGVAFVGVIHPTGSLYLGTLLLAWLASHRWSAQRDNSHSGRLAIISAVVLGIAVITVMGIFSPRMLDTPVWAEYGWQGGLPLLIFNGPLLLALAGWTLWRFNASFEVWLLGLWMAMQWMLTWVHLLDGMVGISVLTLTSYMLYSMALHAVHIPLAVLAGVGLAKVPRLTPRLRMRRLEESEAEIADGGEMSLIELEIPLANERRPVQSLMVVALTFILMSHIVLVEMSMHPEFEVQTDGDRALIQEIEELPEGSILYTETAHWGILYDINPELGLTSFPSLGLLTIEERVQWDAERAILRDDVEGIVALGITHAATSPRGQIGHVLSESDHWAIMVEERGSRLWKFEATPTDASIKTSVSVFPNETQCGENCEWRPDSWAHADSSHLGIRPNHTAVLNDGSLEFESVQVPRQHRDSDLRITLQMTVPGDIRVSLTVCDLGTTNCSESNARPALGVSTLSVLHHSDYMGEIEVHITATVQSDRWIDPAGFSGRSDRILDSNGLWIHWVEVRNI
ncbi:MAG: hypothetical protein VYA86_02350 [Candidatus Thermoplasmatota archaeon]|nr:hypothetical protein [Candidatus Thermoplasmatota archaeon]